MDARAGDDDFLDGAGIDFRGFGGKPAKLGEGGDQKAPPERPADVPQT